MSILLQHLDLVEAAAADHDVSFAHLEGLLNRERDFALAAADGHSIDLLAARAKAPGAPTNDGPAMMLHVASLATDNLMPSFEDGWSELLPDSPAATNRRTYRSPSRILKLLLLGTADAGVRTVGFPPTRLQRHEFVVGRPGVWSGLLGSLEPSGGACARIVCGFEGVGVRFEVERTWHMEGTDWREEIHVREGERSLTERNAREWLYRVAPPEAVPLVVFDASDVAASMLSSSWRARAIGSLYPSAFLAALESALRRRKEPGAGHADRRDMALRAEAETARTRRRWHRAVRMRSDVRGRIKVHLQDLSDAESERRRVGELSGTPISSVSDHQSQGPRVTVPEPLKDLDGPAVASRVEQGCRSRRDEIVSVHLTERMVDLDEEINHLRASVETARREEERWTETAEAYSRQYRSAAAEVAPAATTTTQDADTERSNRLASCVADLGDRLRRRMCERLRLAFRFHAASLDLVPRCTYEVEFDDLGGYRLFSEPRWAKGPRPSVDERVAFVSLQALRDATGHSTPTFAVLDPAHFDECNLDWLRLRHLPSVAAGGIVLVDSAFASTREGRGGKWFPAAQTGEGA